MPSGSRFRAQLVKHKKSHTYTNEGLSETCMPKHRSGQVRSACTPTWQPCVRAQATLYKKKHYLPVMKATNSARFQTMFPSNHRVVSSGKKHVLSHPKQKEVGLIQSTTHQIYISRSSAVTERKKKIIELIHPKNNGLGRVPSFQFVCACKNVASSSPTCKQGGQNQCKPRTSHRFLGKVGK